MANACHHNADIGESSAIDSLFHVATDTYMDLEDSSSVNTKDISLNWRNDMPEVSGFDCSITLLNKQRVHYNELWCIITEPYLFNVGY